MVVSCMRVGVVRWSYVLESLVADLGAEVFDLGFAEDSSRKISNRKQIVVSNAVSHPGVA